MHQLFSKISLCLLLSRADLNSQICSQVLHVGKVLTAMTRNKHKMERTTDRKVNNPKV